MERFLSFILLVFIVSCRIEAEDIKPNLINGRPVNPGEFDEVVNIREGGGMCTATIIGPRVILTAGHCTREGGEITPVSEEATYVFEKDQMIYKAKCTLAPSYRDGRRGQGSQDIALCKTNRPLDVKFASVTDKEPSPGEKAVLIGYGCIRSKPPRKGNDGILRVGKAVVKKSSTDSNHHWYTGGESLLCYGDSGGPAFLDMEDFENEHHYVAGVNSMGDFFSTSLLTSVKRSMDFIRDFEIANDVKVCGSLMTCDGGEPPPKMCAEEILDLKDSLNRIEQCLLR